MKIDVINKLAENEKNIYAVQLKKLVGSGNILRSFGVKIEDKTTKLEKLCCGEESDGKPFFNICKKILTIKTIKFQIREKTMMYLNNKKQNKTENKSLVLFFFMIKRF